MPFTAKFVGGPNHGQSRDIDEEPLMAPPRIEFPTSPGTAVYVREPMSDDPSAGELGYVYQNKMVS